MVKSGLIVGGISVILNLGIALFFPACSICVGILMGLLVGYLAGVFDLPLTSGDCARSGVGAGGIAGAIGLLGNLIGGVINAAVLSPSGNQMINDLLGLPPSDPATIWGGQLGVACCIGLVNVVLMMGLGAGGGVLWYQITGKNRVDIPQVET